MLMQTVCGAANDRVMSNTVCNCKDKPESEELSMSQMEENLSEEEAHDSDLLPYKTRKENVVTLRKLVT